MKLNKTFMSITAILVLVVAGILSGCVPTVPEVIEVTGVDISEDDQSIKVDETLQLTAVVTPDDATNKAITWESDNPDVAAVDEDGLITALSSGTTNITVTTEDGSFTDSIKITVTSQPSGGGTTPAPKKYEVSFGVYLIPEELPAGLTSRGEDPVPNLAGVEIEIFSDEARTDKVSTVTTDENGMATIKLPNGTYYFIASRERYICGPFDILESIPEIITLPTPIATLTVQGSFTISDEDISDTILIIARDTYIVTFLATENNTQTFGVSRKIDTSPTPLEGVTIEIYEGGFRNTSILERTAKEPVEEFKIATLTTDPNGITQVYLPNGPYTFTASKEGYRNYPYEDLTSSVQRTSPQNYFFVEHTDIIDDPVPVPMNPIYTVTVADVVGGTATVTANPNTEILEGETVTVNISDIADGKVFSSIEVTGDDTGDSVSTTEVTAGEEYTFTMPAEDVTVTANFSEPLYTLTMAVDRTDAGTANYYTGSGTYTAGTKVNISAEAADGYGFFNWTSSATEDLFSGWIHKFSTTSFTMPAENVTVTANFKEALFAEDFTNATIGGIPTNWSSEYKNWYIKGSSYAAGTTPEMYFEWLEIDGFDSTGTYKLISPSFNSNKFSKIILIFKYSTDYFKDTEQYTLKVEYTTDGGTNWKEIWSTAPIKDLEIFQQNIDLSASNRDIQIAWVFDGNPYDISYWAIDDILVLGDE